MRLQFQIQKIDSAHSQITQYLREQILAETWPPGTQLPPIKKMAEQFGTNYRTVHIALTPLVKEGLIVRIHGSGTFVRERSTTLSCVGIYHFVDIWHDSIANYYRTLTSCLQEAFSARKIETSIWIDSRPEIQQSVLFPPLAQAIERREIQSLVAGVVAPISISALERLPIPTCFTSGATEQPNRVAFDFTQMMQSSVAELRRLGCHKVGLISHIHTVPNERDRVFELQLRFYEAFRKAAESCGLETSPDWIMAPGNPIKPSEQYGYDQFKALWSQPQRPDGLVVYPDVLARGVIAACIELGVKVPRELSLVLHRNAEVEFMCPLAVSWIEGSAKRIAESAVDQILKQFFGQPVKPILQQYVLRPLGGSPGPSALGILS